MRSERSAIIQTSRWKGCPGKQSRVSGGDHRDCGVYKLAFGVDFAQFPDEETAVHTAELTLLKSAINLKYPELAVSLGLMALDASVQAIYLQPGGAI